MIRTDIRTEPALSEIPSITVEHAGHRNDPASVLARTWIVTNANGCYASASLSGAVTSRTQGLLVIPDHPLGGTGQKQHRSAVPTEGYVLLSKVDEAVLLTSGEKIALGTNEYYGDVLHPQGYTTIHSCSLRTSVFETILQPAAHTLLSRQVWMDRTRATTFLQYTLLATEHAGEPITLEVLPFCVFRSTRALTDGRNTSPFTVFCDAAACLVTSNDDRHFCAVIGPPDVTIQETGEWYWQVQHRTETSQEDMFQPALLSVSLSLNQTRTFVCSADSQAAYEFGTPWHEEQVSSAWMVQQQYVGSLSESIMQSMPPTAAASRSLFTLPKDSTIDSWNTLLAEMALSAEEEPTRIQPVVRVSRSTGKNKAALKKSKSASPAPAPSIPAHVYAQVTHAVNQCILTRPYGSAQTFRDLPGRDLLVVAGYPFSSAMPTIYATVRSIPGLFLVTGRCTEARALLSRSIEQLAQWSDAQCAESSACYVETLLWTCRVLAEYLARQRDWTMLRESVPVLHTLLRRIIEGTLPDVSITAEDGLLHIPASMRTTTRYLPASLQGGCAAFADINALWYCAVTYMSVWQTALRSVDADQYAEYRLHIREHFATRFWNEDSGYIRSAVDWGVPSSLADSLQASSLLALSLTGSLLSRSQTASMLEQVRMLETPYGIRACLSSSEDATEYICVPSFIGMYADAVLQAGEPVERVRALLLSIPSLLEVHCLGALPEYVVVSHDGIQHSGGYPFSTLSTAETHRALLAL